MELLAADLVRVRRGFMAKINIVGYKIGLPGHPVLRIALGTLMVLFGLMGFLPVLGFWMVAVGLAILAIDMAYVLGHADPLVMDAVGIARATLAGLRSAPLLALLEDAVAMGGQPAAGSGSGARRASAARDSSVEAEAGPR